MELLVLVGPTGVGKTAFALNLAREYCCPIINADSRQIYKEIPIGTAAPTAEERALVPHYFVGTHSVTEDYNAGQYERDCLALIDQLMHNRPIPSGLNTPFAILSGGSMMYIDAVCNGLDDIPSVSGEIRQRVQTLYQEQGILGLQQTLQSLDPEYRKVVDLLNPQRLMHAIEVCWTTGGTYTALRIRKTTPRPFTIKKIGLRRQRDILYNRINERVLQMMDTGLLKEAEAVFRLTGVLDGKLLPNSLNTVGYKELYQYMKGDYTLNEAVSMIQQNSRHYAKRQMTWWNRDTNIEWIDL